MAVKLVLDNKLFTDPPIREASKGFIISLKASGRYQPGTVETLETALALFCAYAEGQEWGGLQSLTTSHIEDYLTYLQVRPRWFGERDKSLRPVSKTHVEGQYRRLKRFFGWCVERGHREDNPLDLIPHPKVDEKTVPTLSEIEFADLMRYLELQPVRSRARRFRVTRDGSVLLAFWDTPARRNELANLKVGDVDLDDGGILVMGKGRRERWMPIGANVIETFWEYMQARTAVEPATDAFWVDSRGKQMKPSWVHLFAKAAGCERWDTYSHSPISPYLSLSHEVGERSKPSQ